MNIGAFVLVYFAHCSFLFWILTEGKRKLGMDEKQTGKVLMDDDGMKIEDEENFEAHGLGLPRFVAPYIVQIGA